MFHVGNDRLAIEISAKECQFPDDLRARLMPRFEDLGRAAEEFGQSQFWLTIVFHPRTQVYHAQAKLKLPGETIITGDRNPYLDIAIERCLEKVRQRIDAYRADPDREVRERVLRQVNQTTEIIAPVEPDSGQLGQAAMAGAYPMFRRALLGHEEWVRMRVGRWIQRYPEIQDQVGQSFAIADLVEEVFLTAFERYPQRPTHISLHEWLDSLIDPSVKDFWSDPEDRMAASFAQSLAT
jgi:hypothetical protein